MRPDSVARVRLRNLLVPACVVVAFAGCARSSSEQAALDLAERSLGGGLSSVDLEYRHEVDGGYVWRVAPRPLGSSGDVPRPTHLGVIACADGDAATEAVRFSFLHWEPERCGDGRAVLRRVSLSPEEDARRLDAFISPPRGIEGDPGLHRVTG